MSEHTPHPSLAATAHLVESERLHATLPLVDKRHHDHHLQLALVNAVLSVAASLLNGGDWQTTKPERDEPRYPAWCRGDLGRFLVAAPETRCAQPADF